MAKWIQRTKLKKGTLRRQVKREFGSKGFTARNTIKREVLEKLSKRPGATGKRARLALTLRRLK